MLTIAAQRLPTWYINTQVSKLLQYSPVDRMTAIEAMQHPFFDELRENETCLPNGRPLPPLFNWQPEEQAYIGAELQARISLPANQGGASGSAE